MSFDRRDFLRMAGLGGILSVAPIEQFLSLMTRDMIRTAVAEGSGLTQARNYLNIYMPGGPNRYVFDQWLRTSSSDPSLHFNPMTATAFKAGQGTEGEYRTFLYKGHQVPHLFSQSVRIGSGLVPISNLLDSMMVIRGFGTGFDGHAFNAMAQLAPLGGADTITALSANESTKTFDAVQWPSRGSSSVFNSTGGKSLNQLSGANPLNTLTEGFAKLPSSLSKVSDLRRRQKEAFNYAHARLKTFAESESPGAKAMSQNLQKARALMQKGVNGISDYWGPAVTRYQGIICEAVRTTNIPGVSDRQIVRTTESNEGSFGIQLPEGGKVISTGFDLRGMIEQASIQVLAESLALAEYCFSESLATALEVMASHLLNVAAPIDGESGIKMRTHISDMHGTGSVPALILMNAYFRGLSAGLLELIRVLSGKTTDGKNLWSQTVIHLHGDFARSARSNGYGTDHGFSQIVTSAFSGAMTSGPYLVGNIKQGQPVSNGAGYLGSQGHGAPIENYLQKGIPNPQVAASTIAELIGASRNPFKNGAPPLAQFENGLWTVKYPSKVIGGA
jgi:hypothetical protein